MRMFFNHGLTPEELFTNTPSAITKKTWGWFIARYGWSPSRESSMSDPFKYAFGLVLHHIIDHRIRFIVPGVPQAYIDFEIVTGDRFEMQRQTGRFQGIDFIESDFTGYAIRYFYKARSYQKAYPIYIGGELKEKFYNGINSGIKYYTKSDITIAHFMPQIIEKFPDIPELELKKLVLHGFRRMHGAIRMGCAISITTKKFINCVAHIGVIYLNPEKQIKQYAIRRDRKLRRISSWLRLPFDGSYYIGLNKTALEKWIELNEKSRTVVKFENVIPRRLKEEIYYRSNHVYIFEFKVKKFRGWTYWVDSIRLDKVVYIGEAIDGKFIPSTKTWKELMKEYAKQ